MHTPVCVITGGGSGMGLEAAKYLPKEQVLVLTGRTLTKLERASSELQELGFTVYTHACDTSIRAQVRDLAAFSASLGAVKTVIHAAGMSPGMADPETLLRVNALGTVYINKEFRGVMTKGGVIVDIASNSAYALPGPIVMLAQRSYPLAETDEAAFLKKAMRLASLAKTDYEKSGFAYAISKNFVVWYARKCAFAYGRAGIRVCSLSPGLVATDMGQLEKESGKRLIGYSAEGRMGKPEELGFAIATVADARNGYLAGVDVLVDGGSTYGKAFRH